MSRKDYVLSKLIPEDENEGEAWVELSNMLLSRIEAVESGQPAQQTFEQLTGEIIKSKRSFKCCLKNIQKNR